MWIYLYTLNCHTNDIWIRCFSFFNFSNVTGIISEAREKFHLELPFFYVEYLKILKIQYLMQISFINFITHFYGHKGKNKRVWEHWVFVDSTEQEDSGRGTSLRTSVSNVLHLAVSQTHSNVVYLYLWHVRLAH